MLRCVGRLLCRLGLHDPVVWVTVWAYPELGSAAEEVEPGMLWSSRCRRCDILDEVVFPDSHLWESPRRPAQHDTYPAEVLAIMHNKGKKAHAQA